MQKRKQVKNKQKLKVMIFLQAYEKALQMINIKNKNLFLKYKRKMLKLYQKVDLD